MAESMSELRDKLSRSRATARTLREKTERAGRMTTTVALGASGGALAAVLQNKMPAVAGVDSRLLVGGALTVAALTDMAGQWSDELLSIGSGVLAVQTYELIAISLAGAATR